jgi:hypothetical protein
MAKVIELSEPDKQKPLCLRVEDTVRMTGISKSNIYRWMNAGEFRVYRIKRPGSNRGTTLIDYASFKAFLERH